MISDGVLDDAIGALPTFADEANVDCVAVTVVECGVAAAAVVVVAAVVVAPAFARTAAHVGRMTPTSTPISVEWK